MRNDYFPEELPPCFNSEAFADKYLELTVAFEKNMPHSEPLRFSGFKNKSSRRKFAIPNPYQYMYAAKTIVDNSNEIFAIFNENKNSLTVPIEKAPENHIVYSKRGSKLSDTKESVRKIYRNNLYEIRVDIQSFF